MTSERHGSGVECMERLQLNEDIQVTRTFFEIDISVKVLVAVSTTMNETVDVPFVEFFS